MPTTSNQVTTAHLLSNKPEKLKASMKVDSIPMVKSTDLDTKINNQPLFINNLNKGKDPKILSI